METFSPRQLDVIASGNKTICWIFRVQRAGETTAWANDAANIWASDLNNIWADSVIGDPYYWSTGSMTSSGNETINVGAIEAPGSWTEREWERYEPFKIINFSGITLRRNKSESGIHAPNDVSFTISNAGNGIDAGELVGGTVRIGLAIKDSVSWEMCGSWRFLIKSASPYNQQIDVTCEDFVQGFLRGAYPNTRLVSDIFPPVGDMAADTLCVPEPYGVCYVPLRSVYSVADRYYLLGPDADSNGEPITYSIYEVRSPRAVGAKITWSSPGFDFVQSSVSGWRMFQPLIADGESGIFMTGSSILDMPTKFSRSDTVGMTNPAHVIRRVLSNMGVPDYDVDGPSFDAAAVTFAGWGLSWNFAFYTQEDRSAVLSRLLAMCHSALVIGEQISLKPLDNSSQKTITTAEVTKGQEVGPDTFQYADSIAEKTSDSGYVSYRPAGESQDGPVKILVPANTTTEVIDSESVDFPGVNDEAKARAIGTLYFQRKFLKRAAVSATLKGTCLALRPDDVVTISGADYGGAYDILVEDVTINPDVSIGISGTRFSPDIPDFAVSTP